MASQAEQWETELIQWHAKLKSSYDANIAQAFINEIGDFYESKQELIEIEFEQDLSESDQYNNSSLLESLDGKDCVFFQNLIHNHSKVMQFWKFFDALAFGKSTPDAVIISEYEILPDIDRDNIIKQDAICCYQWRIPRFTPSEIDLLPVGFIRESFGDVIPSEIISILVSYAFPDSIIANIKNCKNGDIFESGVFEYKSCKFCLQLWPKGNDANQHSPLKLGIKWMESDHYIKKLEVEFSIELMEKSINVCEQRMKFLAKQTGMLHGINAEVAHHNDLKDFNSLTWNIFIIKFRAFTEDFHQLFCDQVDDNRWKVLDRYEDVDDMEHTKVMVPIITDEQQGYNE